jgi:hypothetical protein
MAAVTRPSEPLQAPRAAGSVAERAVRVGRGVRSRRAKGQRDEFRLYLGQRVRLGERNYTGDGTPSFIFQSERASPQ